MNRLKNKLPENVWTWIFFVCFALAVLASYLNFNFDARKYKADMLVCKTEADLAFNGIVSEYNGGGEKNSNSFSFVLNDKAIYTIPRSAIGFPLRTDDTIIKRLGEHRYFIYHNKRFTWPYNKQRDTITYECY